MSLLGAFGSMVGMVEAPKPEYIAAGINRVVDAAVRVAVLAERERCAKIAEGGFINDQSEHGEYLRAGAHLIAAIIRSTGEKTDAER